jgi:hypothetical protein
MPPMGLGVVGRAMGAGRAPAKSPLTAELTAAGDGVLRASWDNDIRRAVGHVTA